MVNREVVPLYACPADWRLASPQQSLVGPYVALSSYLNVGPPVGEGVLTARRTTRPGDVQDGHSNTIIVSERPPPNSFIAGWWYSAWITLEWVSQGAGPNGGLGVTYNPQADPTCLQCFGPGRIDNEYDRYHFWSLHSGGGNFLFADAGVRFMPYSAAPILPAMANMSGGEVVE